jgi:BMFP domain-containing protein YqiC
MTMAMKPQQVMSELVEQAVGCFDAALKTGVKLQEDATKWWSDMLNEAGSIQEWQKKLTSCMTDAIPTAQKNAEECLHMIDQNTRSSMDLLKKAFDACQSESIADAQGKMQELWSASLSALRQNAQTIVQTNARVMESWVAFCKAGPDGRRAPAAAGA